MRPDLLQFAEPRPVYPDAGGSAWLRRNKSKSDPDWFHNPSYANQTRGEKHIIWYVEYSSTHYGLIDECPLTPWDETTKPQTRRS